MASPTVRQRLNCPDIGHPLLRLIVERGEGRADSGELRGESGEPFDGAQGEWRVER